LSEKTPILRESKEKSQMASKDFIKVIFLGDTKTGKTCIIDRIKGRDFEHKLPTKGWQIDDIVVETERGNVKMQICELGNGKSVEGIDDGPFANADLCVLVYDATNNKTFENLPYWRDFFMEHAKPATPDFFPFVILGNKQDDDKSLEVSKTQAIAWCRSQGNNFEFLHISARTKDNVVHSFKTIIRIVVINFSDKEKENVTVRQQNEPSDLNTRSTIMLEATGRIVAGLSTSYDEHYPLLLYGKVTKAEFKDTVNKINSYMSNKLPQEPTKGCLPCFKKRISTSEFEEGINKILNEESKNIYSAKGVNWRFMKDGQHSWIEITATN
jgi:GTPase SAR1 family protein